MSTYIKGMMKLVDHILGDLKSTPEALQLAREFKELNSQVSKGGALPLEWRNIKTYVKTGKSYNFDMEAQGFDADTIRLLQERHPNMNIVKGPKVYDAASGMKLFKH